MLKTLKVKTYFTPEGAPTCAKDFEASKVCVFFEFIGITQTIGHCFMCKRAFELPDTGYTPVLNTCPLHDA